MNEIAKHDKNFQLETGIGKADLRFYSALENPFSIHGVYEDAGRFRRMPREIAARVNEGVAHLHRHTAGGRVRFRTDSPYIAIKAEMDHVGKMPHFALSGSAGFDLYVRPEGGEEEFFGSFVPPFDITDGYEGCIDLGRRKGASGGLGRVEATIHFPLYSGVKQLYIGLAEGAELSAASPYRIEKPVVYYGSSITQGGCASRPGAAYPAILSRALDCDHVNLGFSGNARGEEEIGRYIAEMEMCAFVYDYDHNAPSAEHLRATHERMLLQIRERQPDLPILLMTAVSLPRFFDDRAERREIIYRTYQNALARGDRRIWFLDGGALFDRHENVGTVEGCHPNDLGFAIMADAVKPILAEMLKG